MKLAVGSHQSLSDGYSALLPARSAPDKTVPNEGVGAALQLQLLQDSWNVALEPWSPSTLHGTNKTSIWCRVHEYYTWNLTGPEKEAK